MTTFDAQVDAYVREYKERLEAVFKQSAQDVLEDAQKPVAKGGRMPVDTGFLRNTSFQSGLNGATAASGADGYVLTIAGADLRDVVSARWTASYARHVEYGAKGRAGRFFVRGAAQKWQAFVNANAARLKNGG